MLELKKESGIGVLELYFEVEHFRRATKSDIDDIDTTGSGKLTVGG